MRSPDAPPTCPTGELGGQQPCLEGVVGPEIAQQRHADHNVLSTMLRAIAGRGTYTQMRADIPSPQQFVPHPKLSEMLSATPNSGDIAGAHLPGRVPPTVWDGEPGSTAPRLGG